MKKSKQPRLKPRDAGSFEYVFNSDIIKLHGPEWWKKFCKVAGTNTHSVIPEECIPKGYEKEAWKNFYYQDYSRFANKVDYGTPTYFD